MLSYTSTVTRGKRFFSNWGKHPSPISPGYRQSQFLEAGERTVFIARRGREGPLHVAGRREFGQLHDRVGEGSDDFIRPGIAQALGRLGDVFGRAPEVDGNFQIRKLRA